MKKISLTILAGLFLIASCSKKSAPTADQTPKPIDGARVFSSNCARCHGAQGIKDDRTPNLQTIPLDKDHLIASITNGKGHMPAFQDKLSAAEISAVADLIVSWHKK
jgi:cytochrome c6